MRPNTIDRRRTVLSRFLRDVGDPLEVGTEQIEEWLDGRDLAAISRSTYIAHLKSFYEWMVRDELRDDNPVTRIERPRLARMVPRPISDTDLAEALTQAPPRMRAWLVLAAYEGLRCFEIAPLRRHEVLDTHDPPLLIVADGKGGHQRVLPLHPEVPAALRSGSTPGRDGYLFLSQTGRPYQEHTLSQYGNQFLHSLGIESTMHQLRHWFGTQVYAKSRDLRLTQELMGHASPITTAGYAAWATSEAYDVVSELRVNGHGNLRLFPIQSRKMGSA